MQWYGTLPFVGLLLAIAVLPQLPVTAHKWENSNLFKLAVAGLFGVPVALWQARSGNAFGVVEALVSYGQFMAVVGAFYLVSGNVKLTGDIAARPRNNAAFLALGSALALLMGTTGASLLLIRPLLSTNSQRKNKVHTVFFFILLVSNWGGLMPVGAPLFMGLLEGVPFGWYVTLLPAWAFATALGLAAYLPIETLAYRREKVSDIMQDEAQIRPIQLHEAGKNIPLILGMVVLIARCPSIDLETIHHGHAPLAAYVPWRELGMALCVAVSFRVTNREKVNSTNLGPLKEVGALFAGIFLAMIPAMAYLQQIAPGLPTSPFAIFAFAAGLSGYLDNAPTYVAFMKVAKGVAGQFRGAKMVAGMPQILLIAASLGACFGGMLSYIGNAPNLLVAAVAQDKKEEGGGVTMPSFGGYMMRYSFPIGLPLLSIIALTLLGEGLSRYIGIALAAALGMVSVAVTIKYRRKDL